MSVFVRNCTKIIYCRGVRSVCYVNGTPNNPNNTASNQVVVKRDIFGPPDPKSNLRLITFYIPPNETKEETEYRLRRAEVQDWNHAFWAEHNTQFQKAKEEYVSAQMSARQAGPNDGNIALTADEMSGFYREFSNFNLQKHKNYNKEWHKKNLKLLWPGVKAFFGKCRREFLSAKEGSAKHPNQDHN